MGRRAGLAGERGPRIGRETVRTSRAKQSPVAHLAQYIVLRAVRSHLRKPTRCGSSHFAPYVVLPAVAQHRHRPGPRRAGHGPVRHGEAAFFLPHASGKRISPAPRAARVTAADLEMCLVGHQRGSQGVRYSQLRGEAVRDGDDSWPQVRAPARWGATQCWRWYPDCRTAHPCHVGPHGYQRDPDARRARLRPASCA